MRIVSTAWIQGPVEDFEANCALPVHRRLGYDATRTKLDLFVLEGYDKLPPFFVDAQAERGIILHNAASVTLALLDQFAGLTREVPGARYETYCFIRWLVLKEMLCGEQFLHIDLDLFLQENLDRVSQIFSGRTGTFGSPCLTSVGSREWLPAYADALQRLLVDRDGLQRELRWGGNEFRANISSDQDLVSALEPRNALPRSGLDAVDDQYAVFINPLWPYRHPPRSPFLYEDRGGRDFIGNKPVLFWHFQNNFADFVSRYFIVSHYTDRPQRLDFPFPTLKPSAENFAFSALRDIAWPILSAHVRQGREPDELGIEKFLSRTWVSDAFVVQRKARDLFSPEWWWEDNVFAR